MQRSLLLAVALLMTALAVALGAMPAFAASGDQQLADQGAINTSDLTGTWTASPNDPAATKRNLKLAARTKGCADYVKFVKANLAAPHAASDVYTSAGGAHISDQVAVHADATAATAALDTFRSATIAGCLSTVFTAALRTQLAKDPTFRNRIRDVSMTMEPVTAALGSYPTVAYKGTAKVDLTNGASQSVNAALVAVLVDRAILAYSVAAPTTAVNDLNSALNSAPLSTTSRTATALAGAN